MKKPLQTFLKTSIISLLVVIQMGTMILYQNVAVTAQEEGLEKTQDQEATSATTTSLKERIEKVVEEKEGKNNSTNGETKYNPRAIVGIIERVSESAITISNNSGSIIIPITNEVELTKDNKSFEVNNIEIGNSIITLGLQAGETFTPIKIIIEDNRILPRPQVVAIGAVKEVSKNSLTLESRLNNSTFTFSLDKDTQIFDAEDDEISTLSLFEDVQVVVAGYVSTENDDEQSNTAQVIKALVNLD